VYLCGVVLLPQLVFYTLHVLQFLNFQVNTCWPKTKEAAEKARLVKTQRTNIHVCLWFQLLQLESGTGVAVVLLAVVVMA
jgi:hypothetical protein